MTTTDRIAALEQRLVELEGKLGLACPGLVEHPQRGVERVKIAVALFYGLTVADLLGRARPDRIAWPRQVAMWLCRTYLNMPLASVGHEFGGRDHGTVCWAVAKVEAMESIRGERHGQVVEWRKFGEGLRNELTQKEQP
jgi:hypothetical protein